MRTRGIIISKRLHTRDSVITAGIMCTDIILYTFRIPRLITANADLPLQAFACYELIYQRLRFWCHQILHLVNHRHLIVGRISVCNTIYLNPCFDAR